MTLEALLKVGVLVDVTTNDGTFYTGYLDEVGITQHEGKILIADQHPLNGVTFKGKKIAIKDIKSINLSSKDKPNF